MNIDRVVIAGASLAGMKAAQAARAAGYAGRLTLIGDEKLAPYDRPPLSKEFLAEAGPAQPPHFEGALSLAADLDLELLLGEPATGVDTTAQRVTVGDREIAYDAMVVTTGAVPRRLPTALAGVTTLRTAADAEQVADGLRRGARIVVVGGGFIGSEVASAARGQGLPVTIVEAAPVPLVRAVGAVAGEWLSELHRRHGTELIRGVGVESLSGDGHVRAVHLADGRVLPADLVVVGIGADPATSWLRGSGLDVSDGVACDATLYAGHNVWAAGDVARWWSEDFDRSLRIEHWTSAAEQGALAMRNLLAGQEAVAYRHIPYFWSDWYGSRIQLVGLPSGRPEIVTGLPDSDKFVALFREGDRLVGALALNRRSDIMKYRALIARGGSWEDGLALAEKRNQRAVAL
ncbi:FAD-dependent oxidoreductase [Rhodococcus pyridinivorans]|uniref:FAD-dependent oxidoreductase n=2 Tax=Rhodococcus pyridinivorans TaxID=103816 RepID=A0A7M2XLH9_9NOCA|nr:FAD-dependent oxidoreductase [Rhodococcus pyridinivorans]QOV98628.1 FAD-dependent oxidoreductase [Rhodococcus pyridinivorans]UPW06569.1 FAD-dependent oxidoreductase [Rhodococcus pyridinivorans]WMM72522.1 FAD-dependent oxidoreductase [Rhodococcus pyridinivorans]